MYRPTLLVLQHGGYNKKLMRALMFIVLCLTNPPPSRGMKKLKVWMADRIYRKCYSAVLDTSKLLFVVFRN